MTLTGVCLAGLAGAGAVEVSELYSAMRAAKEFPWRLPGEARLSVYLSSVVLRLALGVFAAWFCARTGPLDTAGAVAAGIAAPKLLEQLGRSPAPAAARSSAARVSGRARGAKSSTTGTASAAPVRALGVLEKGEAE